MNYTNQEHLTRILSIDYGDQKIGLAISDPMKIIAKPFKVIRNTSEKEVLNNIRDIINEKSIEKIVIGLPLTLKNTYSEQTKKVKIFTDILKQKLDLPIITYDERLTSLEAKKSLIKQGIKTGHNKEFVDMTAAAIFLQSYLDENSDSK